jgi:hypothetical protein
MGFEVSGFGLSCEASVTLCFTLAIWTFGCDGGGGSSRGDAGAERGIIVDGGVTDVLPDATGSRCRLNSDCLPQLFCNDDGRCTFECREDRDCASERCVSGQCRPSLSQVPDASTLRDTGSQIGECVEDNDCIGRAQICEAGVCTSDCTVTSCPDGQTCNSSTGRCSEAIDVCTNVHCALDEFCDVNSGACVALPADCRTTACPEGFICRTPDGRCVRVPTDCRASACPELFECDQETGRCQLQPDCRRDGCPDGQRCDDQSHACVAAHGDGTLGSACQRAAECESNLCLEVSVEGENHVVCATPCCSEFDCPLGFGCRYTLGINVCLPSRIYPPGYSFDAATGQPCGAGARACQSGLCNLGENQCLGICCTDADCGGRLCQLRQVGERARAICGLNLVGLGQTGAGCASELDCMSGICVPVAGGVGGLPGQCADLCCTNAQCLGQTTCGQIVGLGGTIVSACVPLPPGPSADGQACQSDATCASGQCVERACRQPCCLDTDCAGGQRCLPRPNDEGSFVRVCVPDGA